MATPTQTLELLSAYRDGEELSTAERTRLEEAMVKDPSLRGRIADLDALSGAVRATLEQAADQVDFTGFADKVLARTTAHRPPLGERLRVYFSEMFEYRKLQLVMSAAAAAAVVVGGPLLVARAVVGEASSPELARAPSLVAPAAPRTTVRSVRTPENHEAVLFKTRSGTSVIYVREK